MALVDGFKFNVSVEAHFCFIYISMSFITAAFDIGFDWSHVTYLGNKIV